MSFLWFGRSGKKLTITKNDEASPKSSGDDYQPSKHNCNGLSNAETNMKAPIGREGCLRLCSIYDNWEGGKIPSPAKTFRIVGPGMVLYSIYSATESDPRQLRRGVIFYKTYEGYKATIFEWFDYGDGGCPSFRVRDELVHVKGDIYRTKAPFKAYESGVSVIGELNWNTRTDEFAYREIPIADEKGDL